MGIFDRISKALGLEFMTSIAVPQPAYAGIPTSLPVSSPSITYNPPAPERRANRLSLSEFRSLSLEEQTDIQDFVNFRYQNRISNKRFERASIYDIKSDLTRKLQVPTGKSHKYLSRELIDCLLN